MKMWLIHSIRRSLVFKGTLLLLLMLTFVLGTGVAISYFSAQDLLARSVHQKAELICRENVNRFDQSFFKCESIANLLATILAKHPSKDWQNILDVMFKSIAMEDENKILAIGAAIVPEKSDGNFSLILHKSDSGGTGNGDFQHLNSNQYVDQDWFSSVVRDGKGKWNEPFTGKLIYEPIAVYSRPIFHIMPDGNKKVIGVVCIDIGLQWMDRKIRELSIDYGGKAFLISNQEQLLSGADPAWIEKNIQDLNPEKLDYCYDEIADELEQKIIQKSPGYFTVPHRKTGEKGQFFFQPMRSTGWSFCILFPEKEICAPMRFFRFIIIIMIAVIFIVIVSFVSLMASRIAHSLNEIKLFSREIGKGNFSAPIPKIKGKNELSMIVMIIDQMRLSLMQYIEDLKKATTINEVIESELLLAQQIQYGLLPDIRTLFAGCGSFEVSARLYSAKEIGGDLYDCAMVAPDKLYFVIGDVSGKGIPAALFMCFTQVAQCILHRNQDLSPKMIVSKMNEILLIHNKRRLFVTFICGFIDAKTGIITYCNAGHNPFFILKKDGSLEDSCQRNGLPLGLRAGLTYTESVCQMEPGDTLFLYTDGITDAENSAGEFYGTARLKEFLRKCGGKGLPADEIEQELIKSLHEFTNLCEQSDDATSLTIRYKAPLNS